MKKIIFLFFTIFLLNGCAESVAILGTTAGGASSGKMVQSSLTSVASYGIKSQTGKTPLGHALAYAEKMNPDKKKEPCLSFIEKTNSEVCTIVKKQIIWWLIQNTWYRHLYYFKRRLLRNHASGMEI